MTQHEIELAKALGWCSFLPGSSMKRFCRDLAFVATHSPEKEISLRQRHYMELMAWRFRKQLPRRLVPNSKPLDLPPRRKEPKKPRKKAAAAAPDRDLFA